MGYPRIPQNMASIKLMIVDNNDWRMDYNDWGLPWLLWDKPTQQNWFRAQVDMTMLLHDAFRSMMHEDLVTWS